MSKSDTDIVLEQIDALSTRLVACLDEETFFALQGHAKILSKTSLIFAYIDAYKFSVFELIAQLPEPIQKLYIERCASNVGFAMGIFNNGIKKGN